MNEDAFSIEGQIHTILHRLVEQPKLYLKEIFAKASCKMEIVCTFVAILELVRIKEVLAFQRRAFDDIEIVRNFSNETAPQEQVSN